MKYLKVFDHITNNDIVGWGITVDELEDILLEVIDISNSYILKTPISYRTERGGRRIPEVIFLSRVNRCDRSTILNILKSIKVRLLAYGILVTDSTESHEKTVQSQNIWFVCLRLEHKNDIGKGYRI